MLSPIVIAIIIFFITYIFIATEKVDKTIASIVGACSIVLFHCAPYEELLETVDLNVIFLLVGMMLIVNILSLTGVFEWIAITLAQKSKGNGVTIFILFMLATAFLSAFLDNVTTIILMAPITILITQLLEIPTVPILISEAIFSNIGGTATLVGDPPNILIASRTGLEFNEFLFHLGPAVIIIFTIVIAFVLFFIRKKLIVSEQLKERVMSAKPNKAIVNPFILKRALIVFSVVILGFFMSRALDVDPGIIALMGGFIMAFVCKVDVHEALMKVEWNTILFFIGLFILIGALEINGIFEVMGDYMLEMTEGNLLYTALAVLWFSAIFSSIVDNIPLVIAMIPLINSITIVFAKQMGIEGDPESIRLMVTEPLFWSLALGACLGGNGSLIGASANVVVAQVARRNGYKLSFMDFTKEGFPIMLGSLLISTGYIYFRYF